MANVFEQNDPKPKATVFEQNDPKPDASAPQTHYRWRDVPGAALQHAAKSGNDFAASVFHAAMDPKGTAQGLVNLGIDAPAVLGKTVGGAVLNALTPQVRQMIVNQNPAVLQPMVDTVNQLGAIPKHYKDAYLSGPDNLKRQLAEHPIESLADAATWIPSVGQVGRAVLAAHVPLVGAAAVPVARGAADLINPLSTGNALARGAGMVARKLVGPDVNIGTVGRQIIDASPILGTKNRLILNATKGNESQILQDLRDWQGARSPSGQPHQIVPGSIPTAAEVIAPNVNATQLQALGSASAGRLSDKAKDIADTRNAARLAHIEGVGGTPADIVARKADQTADKTLMYGISDATMTTADDRMLRLVQELPLSVRGNVMRDAAELAAQDGRQFQIGDNVPARTVPSGILDPNGQPVMITTPAQYAQYPGKSLHDIKKAFDGLISKAQAGTDGLTPAQAKALQNTQRQYLQWVGEPQNNPAYIAAKDTFRNHANAIDQMTYLQNMGHTLGTKLMGENTATQRAEAFAKARIGANNDALGHPVEYKTASGRWVTNEREFLHPDHIQALDAIHADLARAKEAEDQARLGGQHKGVLGAPVQDTGLGDLTIRSRVLNALSELFTHGPRDAVANAMMTPDDAAALLSNALARKSQIDTASNVVKKAGKGVQAINRYPAVYNALQAERDARDKKNALAK